MEKYGVKPKRFTKAWWEYFWDYYKWHVFIGALAIFMASITIFQLSTKIDYDAVVTFVGDVSYTDTSVNEISSAFSEIVPDINQNEKNQVQFQVLAVAESESGLENPQYTMGVETKKILEIQTGESFLFIFDTNQTEAVYANELAEGTFAHANEWLGEENMTCERASGGAGEYFVKIPNNGFFKERGFVADELYVGVRNMRDDETQPEKKDAAIELANYLLSYGA